MFHVELQIATLRGVSRGTDESRGPDPEPRSLEHLPQHNEPAAEVLDEGPCGFVDKRRGNKRRRVCTGGGSKQQDPPTQPEEGLDAGQELRLNAHGSHADQVLGFVQFGPCKQVLSPDGFNGGIGQVEMPDSLTEKRRLTRLRLDHDETERGNRDLERNRRRPPARTNVEQARMRAEVGTLSVTVGAAKMAGHDEGLDEQPVNRLVWGVLQRERGEIDLLVPELEQAIVGRQRFSGLGVQGDVRLAGPLRQPLVELPWRHG